MRTLLRRSLCETAERYLHLKGFTEVTLWVLRDNARAIKFYQSNGFVLDVGHEKTLERGGKTLLVSIAGFNPTVFETVSFQRVSPLRGNSRGARSQRAVSRLSRHRLSRMAGRRQSADAARKVRAPRVPSGDFQSQPILPA